jgi:hypothetical protein
MSHFRCSARPIALILAALIAAPAEATFHFWYIKEIYSNESGSVQFIELFTPNSGQQFTDGEQITTGANTFTFDANTGAPTTNKHLLLATASFTSLPGAVPPNFATIPLPPNFFNPAGDTITFIGADAKTFTGLLTGNVNSRNYTGPGAVAASIRVNSPTNFAGGIAGTGSINRGDYNSDGIIDVADYIVWKKTFSQTASPAGVGADGNTDGTINDGDYTLWTQRFGGAIASGAGGGPGAIPEPSTILLTLLLACASLSIVRRRLSPSLTAPLASFTRKLIPAVAYCIGDLRSFRR